MAVALVAVLVAAVVADLLIDRSTRRTVAADLGPIDVRITQSGTADPSRDLGHLEDLIRHSTFDGTDGLLTLMTADATLRRDDSGPESIDGACVADADFAAVRHFGPDPDLGGMADAGSGPRPGEIVLPATSADRLGVSTGDNVGLTVAGATETLVVVDVLDPVGLAGYCDALVPSGLILGADPSGGEPGLHPPPRGELLLSRRGGLLDGAEGARSTAEEVHRVIEDAGIEGAVVDTPKSDLIDDAAETQARSRRGFLIVGALLAITLMVLGAAATRQAAPAERPTPPRRDV